MATVPTATPGLYDDELKGFSRTVAEIEWLLVILVLLHQVFQGPDNESAGPVYLALFLYAAFVIGFRYFNFYRAESHWKLAVETWVMVVFITGILYYTGRLESPLVNLYLLVIITSALTLGKIATLLEMGLIAACYVFLGYTTDIENFFTLGYAGDFMTRFAPMLLVAYITTMLSADIRQALSRIKLISETDELTGLYNVRAFTAIVERTFKQAARYQRPFSVLMIDSDNLKSINDSYGHETGNRLLKLTVRSITAAVRDTDVVARYGGDEFVVLLPETGSAGAREMADRVREAVAGTPLDTRGKHVQTTVSIGVAAFPEHGDELATVLARADQALYAAKREGRNRVAVFQV